MTLAAGCRSGADRPLVAVTGATGFIGRHLVVALHQAGFRLRLLLRREPDVPEWRVLPPPEVVAGALDDEAALERLVEGADGVIHLAGLIKAARRRDFFAVNRDGAAAMARAVGRVAPGARFVLVSSLAAREPQLSDYAASKRAGEDAVLEVLGERASVLRPSVVYGPGDRETLVFFQLAGGRLVPLLGSADARAAMIHVADLVRLIVAMARAARARRRGALGRRRPAAGLHLGRAARRGGAGGGQHGAAFRARAAGAARRRGAGRRPGEGLRLEQHDQLAEAARAAPSGLGRRDSGARDRAGLGGAIRSRARLRRRGGLVPKGRLVADVAATAGRSAD